MKEEEDLIKLDEDEEKGISKETNKKEEEEIRNIITKKYENDQKLLSGDIMVSNFEDKGDYVVYTIKGDKIDGELKRRFSEFFAFYEKLKQRWPGVYVPPISKKQIFSNLSLDTLQKRKYQLDRFVRELYKIPYLFESEESQIFFSKNYGIGTDKELIKTLNKLTGLSKAQMYENFENKIKPFYSDSKKRDFNDEQYGYCIQYIDNFIEKLNLYKETCLEFANEKEIIINNSCETLQSYENFEKLAVSEFINKDTSKLMFYNSTNLKLSQAILDFKKGMKNPYQILGHWIRQKEIELLSMKESLNKYKKMYTEKENISSEITSLETKLNNLNQGKKSFFDTITFKDPEKLKEKYSKEKEQKEIDLDSLGKMLDILKDYYSFYIYEYFKLLKFSLYDLMKSFADSQLNNSVKSSEFWLLVKIEE